MTSASASADTETFPELFCDAQLTCARREVSSRPIARGLDGDSDTVQVKGALPPSYSLLLSLMLVSPKVSASDSGVASDGEQGIIR